MTVYSKDIKQIMDIIIEGIEEKEEHLIIAGDLNARTGEEEVENLRKSKDKMINQEGKILLEKLRKRGWFIMNGTRRIEANWTYIGEVGTSVTDCTIVNGEVETFVKKTPYHPYRFINDSPIPTFVRIIT